jgi:uncharacterized protein YraI
MRAIEHPGARERRIPVLWAEKDRHMKTTLLAGALGLSLFASAAALAATGYVVQSVSLQAGPDASYPSVGMLGAGTTVVIEGCINGWSWCDVGTPNGRGWVSGNDLQEDFQGRRVFVPEYGERIGIRFVSFEFGSYWDNNYRNRPWYGERERYRGFRPLYRPIVIDVNLRGGGDRDRDGRDRDGRDRDGRDRDGLDRNGRNRDGHVVRRDGPRDGDRGRDRAGPNNGVEPRRPLAQAQPQPKDTERARPPPRDPKARPAPKASPERDNSNASDREQGQH